jgi:hypothetical protein
MDYSKFNFPPYEFREYPKWVDANGTRVVVDSAEEEAELMQNAGNERQQEPRQKRAYHRKVT